MDFDNYREYVIGTVSQMYPKYLQLQLLSELAKRNIVVDYAGKNKVDHPDALDISGMAEEEKLPNSIRLRKKSMKVIETWEYLKSYKYSVIFEVDNANPNFDALVESGRVKKFSSESDEYDEIGAQPNLPTLYENEKISALKFGYAVDYIQPLTGEPVKIKYPLIAVFFKELGVVEIRFDRVSTILRNGQEFYKPRILFIQNWIGKELGVFVGNINLEPILDKIAKEKGDEVVVYSAEMSFKSGSRATLDVGGNEEYVLPLLGELKKLIEINEEKFDQAPEIKELLETFIQEIEDTADLPWISLCWKGERRSKNIVVRFCHRYKGEQYTLLHHLGLLKGMERMNSVTEYLIAIRDMA